MLDSGVESNFLSKQLKNEIDPIKNFLSKSNQSISSFMSMFDYLNDESVIIKAKNIKDPNENDTLNNSLYEQSNHQISPKVSIKLDEVKEIDDLENIDLEKCEIKLNGFWHNKNINQSTKFDNFILDDSEKKLDNDSLMEDDIEKLISNFKYEPSAMKNKDIYVEKLSKDEADSIRDKISSDSFQDPGCLNENKFENCIQNEQKYLKLNIFKCDSNINENFPIDIVSDLVEQFQLDPNHDYSKYNGMSRFECNQNFLK
ncbi:unnamed protein product [Brachionus calyciflorus]|uniref:Uncharacterized protein n=1 Tax=Brachionus calyciflorus TaxID=104777 RepID=A0A814C4T6_9BILA|nr:unnamed protein product [Brachionus calyciflorus]